MTIANSIKTAWNGIAGNTLRAVLTTLGIVIGVASVISMLALGNGARAEVEANFKNLGSDIIQISVKEQIDQGEMVPIGEMLSYEDGLHMPANVPLVEKVDMSIRGAAKIRREHNVLDMIVIASTANGLQNLAAAQQTQPIDWPDGVRLTPDSFLANGRFFTTNEVLAHANVCVLGHKTALDLFEGDNPIDQVVWINRQKCIVIGVMAKLEVANPTLRNQIRPNEAFYLPISTGIDNFFDDEPSVHISAKVTNESQIGTARQQIIDYLRQRHNVLQDEAGLYEDDFELVTRQDLLGAQQSAARTFSSLLAAMAVVSLVVGGIGIMNVMLVSVTERTREIGVRMAVGAKQTAIVWQFLLESMLISAFGGVLGISVGVLSVPLAANFNQGVALLDPQSIPLAFGVALFTGLVFGLYPAVRASRLDPIEALRYE